MTLLVDHQTGEVIREMATCFTGLRRILPTLTAPSFALSLKRCWRILDGQVTKGFILERKPEERFREYGSTELMIAIHPEHRRQGIATEALNLLVNNLDTAFLLVSPRNISAFSLFSGIRGLVHVQDRQDARIFIVRGHAEA
jgi:ribosomal protein S18 acetylase RimI-like enzyme